MTKTVATHSQKSEVKFFLSDVRALSAIPVSKKHQKMALEEYPFDLQLLSLSRLYRESRKFYLRLGGTYAERVSSTMRSLSAQDLFQDQIDFTPSASELMWFRDHVDEVFDPEAEIAALSRFNEISLYHEQNHRVIWRLLPPAPTEKRDLCRYLNFAESLVVTLDLALGDELGPKLSPIFERMKVIYRTGGKPKWLGSSKQEYRKYLLSLLCSTYFVLETLHPEDVLKAVDYVLPGQKKMNQHALTRSRDINELFTNVTNPEWQERYWKDASQKLKKMHAGSEENPLYLPEDPLDLDQEFHLAQDIFQFFGL